MMATILPISPITSAIFAARVVLDGPLALDSLAKPRTGLLNKLTSCFSDQVIVKDWKGHMSAEIMTEPDARHDPTSVCLSN